PQRDKRAAIVPPFSSTTTDKEVHMDAVNGLSHAQIQELLKPFDDRIVEPRKSDGQKVVPHDYVRGRLSEIFGPLGWSEQQLELTQVATGADGIADARYVDSDSVMRYI